MEATRKQEERESKRRKNEAWGARGNGEQTDLLFDDLLRALRFFNALVDKLSQLGERAQHFVRVPFSNILASFSHLFPPGPPPRFFSIIPKSDSGAIAEPELKFLRRELLSPLP